ncbi:unnamed protein product [Paramecium octaurelia]|uniref:Ion transport domain-containing protein n=1 Tax=Paramecium octaurelia TaxID=43137 RepID=A0A8S1V398_PAROT|nr:unnamed protein product [Paramecium octaurelia]
MFQQFLNCFKNKSAKDGSKEYEKDILSSVLDILPNYQNKKGEAKAAEIRKQANQTDNPKESNDNLIKYDDDDNLYCRFSLDYFALNNRFRVFCIQISQSKLFQWVHSLLSIIVVCVLIVKPYNNESSGLNISISNAVINGIIILCDVIFSIQVVISIISYGIWNCTYGYYKDPYAFINSICLLFALILRQSYLYIFRALFLVDFIVQTKYFQIVKKLSNTVKHALMMTAYVIIIITLLTYIYATMGVQIWSDQLHHYCVKDGEIDAYPARLCGMGRKCPDGYVCQRGYFHQPFTQYDYISFDEIPNGLLTLFICHFIEGWVEVEQNLADTFNKYISSIFLWSYIIIGTFFLQNLLVAILLNQYQMDQQVEEIPKIKVKSQTKIQISNERRRTYFLTPGHLSKSKQRALQLIQNQHNKSRQRSQLQIKLKAIVSSNYIKYFYSLLFITNLILFSLNDESAYHNDFEDKITIINIVFLFIYILEDLARMYVWKQKENKYILLLEFVIDFISIIVQLNDMSNPFVLNAFKGLRLLWFFNTQTSWSNYKVLLQALQKSFVNIPKLILVFLTYMIVIGILGREYFAGELIFNEQGNYDKQGSYIPRANFDSIRNTVSSLFIIICSDQWENIFYTTLETKSWIPYPFFIFVLILCRFFILSSFLTIMLDNYEEAKNEADKSKARAQRVISSMQKTKVVPAAQLQQIQNTSQIEKKRYFGRLSKMSDDSDDEEKESKHQVLQRQASKYPQITIGKNNNIQKQTSIQQVTIIKSNDEVRISYSSSQSYKQYFMNSALFILNNKSILRKRIQQLTQSKYFEWLMSSIIILNIILLGTDLPIYEQKDLIEKFNVIFTIIFIFEIVLRILAHGFIWNQIEPNRAFVYNNQNNFDLAILIVSSISDLNLYSSGYLKAFRALRTLRVFSSARRGSQSEELNLISKSLFQTISLLSSMIFVTGICIWILSIFCMTIWKGKLYFCTNVQSYDDIYTKQDCLDQKGEWINNITNFDTIQDSLLCLFRIIIGEGWTSQMYYVSDITERGMHPKVDSSANYQILYYILLFLLNIMLLNLFTGLIINNYRTIKENISNYKSLNEHQREWLQMMYIMQKKNLIRLIEKPKNQFRQICYSIATYSYFELIILILLLLNLIFCSANGNSINQTTKSAFYVLDIIFITLFHIEVFIKFSAFWYYYLKDSWNKFDILLLISTDALLILNSEIEMPKMFMIPLIIRCLRVLNTYKILKLNRQLKVLIDVIQEILPTLLSVVAFIIIIIIVYALIGIQTLSVVKSTSQDAQYPFYQEIGQRNKNFQNFWDAVLILIEITTGQYWPLYMSDYTINKAGCHSQTPEDILREGVQGCSTFFGYFYFISFLVLIRIIMISLFLAMIIESYQDCLLENTAVINPYQIEDFFLKWSDYDPKGTGWITPEDFAFLMFEMNPPLGFKDENACLQLFDFNQNHKKQSAYIYNPRTKMHLKKIDIFKKLSDFQVLIYQNEMIHIKDVCLQIAYNAVKKKNALHGIEQIEDKVVLRNIRKSWEAKFPDLGDQKFLHFAVDIFAYSSIRNILRGAIERRKVKKRIKEMQKQNNLRQLEINENAYLTTRIADSNHRHRRKSQINKRVFPFAQSSYRIKEQNRDGNVYNRRVALRTDLKQSQQQQASHAESVSLSTHNFYIDPQETNNGFPMKIVLETQKIDFPSDNSQRSFFGQMKLRGDISQRMSDEEGNS